MKSKIVKTGIIGCGHLGKIHCKLLKDISLTNNFVEFIGVFDIDKGKSERIAQEYNVKSFNSFNELLQNINTLIIVTPTSTHFDIADEAINYKINLFIEKPVTSLLEQANNLLKKENSVKIQIGHVERFNPALTSLEEFHIKPLFIESHRLAQFSNRGTDVSVIQDLMIHDIDIILHLVNSKISKIDANGVSIISDEIDIANTRLQFENGCTANITSSRISLKKMRKMRIFQKNAYISIDFLNNKSEVYRLADKSEKIKNKMSIPISEDKQLILEQPSSISDPSNNPIKNELLTFFDSIIENKPIKVTLSEGKEALEVADKIIQIIKANQLKEV